MIKEGVICHAEGPRCLGCDHYHGRAPVCVYAPRPEQQVAPTPRTDALYDDLERQAESGALRHNDVRIRKEEHARQLERELSDERQKYADLSLAYERTDAELSAAKAEAERLREDAKFRPDPRTLWVVWIVKAISDRARRVALLNLRHDLNTIAWESAVKGDPWDKAIESVRAHILEIADDHRRRRNG